MVDDDDARLAVLALREDRGELTVREGTARRGAAARAQSHTTLFTALGRLPDGARRDLFGPETQWALYVYYEEGPVHVGTVLDPPVSVHAPTASGLAASVRALVADHRGVVEADVHPFGKQVDRETALAVLEELLAER